MSALEYDLRHGVYYTPARIIGVYYLPYDEMPWFAEGRGSDYARGASPNLALAHFLEKYGPDYEVRRAEK